MASLLHTALLAASAAAVSIVSGPMTLESFADPSIAWSDGYWYAFATHIDQGTGNVPVARSPDFNNWDYLTGTDALPTVPPWVNTDGNNFATAPDVNRLDDGSWVMYFDAADKASGRNCVGVATAASVAGPYTPQATVAVCPVERGGAIDASGFRDWNGDRYLLYKIDGNILGNGGDCGNGVAPFKPTPILLQQVARDGVTPIGNPIQLIDNNGAADTGIVEAPSLVRSPSGEYFLFFSTGCFADPSYAVEYATAPSIGGPYTRRGKMLQTGTLGLQAPGGMDVFHDGKHALFHAWNDDSYQRRILWTELLDMGAQWNSSRF